MNQVIEESAGTLENKLGNVCLDRANMYLLLSKAVQFPTLELVESLLNGTYYSEAAKSVQWLNEKEGIYSESLKRLEKVTDSGLSPQEMLEKLEQEYNRLFLDSRQKTISPFESDHGNQPKESVIESVKKAYNADKTYMMSDSSLALDHISAELDFLSHLSRQEGLSWINGQEVDAKKSRIKQRTFLVHHLRKWGISFFQDLERSTELEAYKAIASIGRVFMVVEHGN